MSAYTADEHRALAWYGEKINAIPQLSIYPQVRFKVRVTGEIIVDNVKSILSSYKEYIKEVKKEAARQRKADKAQGKK